MGQSISIEALQALAAIAKAGSISGGARALGQPKQTVSSRLKALEAELGVRLVERTTRALHFTAEGHALTVMAEHILAELSETRSFIAGRAKHPEGPLRISAPVLFGQTLLAPAVADFCGRYPRVNLEIELNDRKVDLIHDGFDAAIRVGDILDTSLKSRLLGTSESVLIASPHYLAGGEPLANPSDLINHSGILTPAQASSGEWKLERDGQGVTVKPRHACKVSSLKLAADIAAAGAGITLVPAFLARKGIEYRELVRVLPLWRGGTTDIHIVYPARRFIAPRVSAFIDVLVEHFPKKPLADIA